MRPLALTLSLLLMAPGCLFPIACDTMAMV